MEELKNNLPIISVGLLILGTINILIYYSYFNIDILSYLDFTEILQIQFKLFSISGAILIAFYMFFQSLTFIGEIGDSDSERESQKIKTNIKRLNNLKDKNIILPETEQEVGYKKFIIKESNYYRRRREAESKDSKGFLVKVKVSIIIILFAIPIGSVLLVLTKDIPQMSMLNVHILSIPLFAIFTLLAYLGLRKEGIFFFLKEDELQKRRDFYKICCLFILLAFTSGSYARISAIRLIIYSSDYEMSFKHNDNNIVTNKNYRYIGKTKNYLFLYDINKKQSDVFKFDDIKNLSIKNGVKYK